jgi:hypothetical protein
MTNRIGAPFSELRFAAEPLPSKSTMPAIVLAVRRHYAAKGRNHDLLDVTRAGVGTPSLATSTAKVGRLELKERILKASQQQ